VKRKDGGGRKKRSAKAVRCGAEQDDQGEKRGKEKRGGENRGARAALAPAKGGEGAKKGGEEKPLRDPDLRKNLLRKRGKGGRWGGR